MSKFVIYSADEASRSGDGAGYWSNELGWTLLEKATRFSKEEIEALNLPNTENRDAKWIRAPKSTGKI